MSHTLKQIEQAVLDRLNSDFDDATPETTIDDLGLDSLDVIEFSINLERDLSIDIHDDVVEKFTSSKTAKEIAGIIFEECI